VVILEWTNDTAGTPSAIVAAPFLLYALPKMQSRTETLEVGSRAPEFSLGAANREGVFTLGSFLAQGYLILEFLRGTW
jgi:hypothetical protein